MKLDFLVKILFEIILGLKPFAFTEIIRYSGENLTGINYIFKTILILKS